MIAIIPAAGKGTRVQYKTKGGSKELIKYKGKAAIDWAIEEAMQVTDKVFVVINPRKKDLVIHLGVKWYGRVHLVIQERPLGLGDAVLRCARFVHSDFFLLLPDDIYPTSRPLKLLQKANANLVLKRVPLKDTHLYGILNPITGHIEEKPAVASSRYAVMGRYILPPTIFDLLHYSKLNNEREVCLTDALNSLDLTHIELRAKRIDLGK